MICKLPSKIVPPTPSPCQKPNNKGCIILNTLFLLKSYCWVWLIVASWIPFSIEKQSNVYIFYSCQIASTMKRNKAHVSFSVLFTWVCLYMHLCAHVCMYALFSLGEKVISLTVKHPVFSIRSHLLHISAFKLLLNHRIWQASLEGIWG